MNREPNQIEQVKGIIQSAGIRFVNLQFTDIMGMVKSVGIPVDMWQEVLDHGLWFDGSSVQGFARIAESDMLLHPDLDTFAVIPWDTDVPTAGHLRRAPAHRRAVPATTQRVLKRALAKRPGMGYEFYTGPELEFFCSGPSPTGHSFRSCPTTRPAILT
jgi:glutamine synthetase